MSDPINLPAMLRALAQALMQDLEYLHMAAQEIERLQREVDRWRQVWDNVKLDAPNLHEDNQPLAVAVAYALLRKDAHDLSAAVELLRCWIGYGGPPVEKQEATRAFVERHSPTKPDERRALIDAGDDDE